ncbi:hypothetical protein DL770_003617 [Monosporascus sp. CRB-9-2]|nr:hypothetical protein DL770_003617 [Monosporascus sp. CRB-9-2]
MASVPSIHRIRSAEDNAKLSALRRQLSGVNMKGNLTGFTTNPELACWLQSEAVAPFTDELARDYIERDYLAAKPHDSDEETDFFNHLEHAMATIDDPVRLKQYTGRAPKKAGWSKYDHATRFMVQIIRYDKENEGPCRWAEGLDDMAAGYAYEVYCFVLDNFLENWKVEQAAEGLARVQLRGMCGH